jgi:hypothetical protein
MVDLKIDYEASKTYAMNTFKFPDSHELSIEHKSFGVFIMKAVNDTTLTNELLDSEMAYYKDYGTVLFPSIVINN